jgi:hypothetical protein
LIIVQEVFMVMKFKRPKFSSGPQEGTAEGGESINPTGLSDESDLCEESKPRAMPFPGLPVSREEYQRLKDAAANSTTPPLNIAQEDPPRKKRKKL